MLFPSAHNFFFFGRRKEEKNARKSENAQRYYLASYKLASQVVIDGWSSENGKRKENGSERENEKINFTLS
jgi:hypothetical protein